MTDTTEPRLGALVTETECVSEIMQDIKARLRKMANRLRPSAQEAGPAQTTLDAPRQDTHLGRLHDANQSALVSGKNIHDLLLELEGLI